MTKFCVGKVYKKETGHKTKCLAVTESSIHGPLIVMEDFDFSIWTFHLQDYERGDVVKMSEYKEPVRHERFVSWYRHTDGAVVAYIRATRGHQKPGLPYQDGVLLKVDTISYTET